MSVVKMSEMLDVENRVHEVLGELSTLWREVGFEDECLLDRQQTVYHSINNILTRMLKEEKKYKSRLLDSLEKSENTIMKLRREMGIRYVILFLFFKFLKVIFSTLALS